MEWPVFSIHIMRRRLVLFLIPLLAFVLSSSQLLADPVPVKYREGSVHGSLAVRSLDGMVTAMLCWVCPINDEGCVPSLFVLPKARE